jgi:REP element-mobilizing transposase RayT
MSGYHQILYHIVFSTKNRIPALLEAESAELYKYIWGIIKNNNCHLYRINGIENHIHIICDLHPSCKLSDLIKDIKVASSLWIKSSGKYPKFAGWADGYAAITLSIKEKDVVINYVKNQREHHKKLSFIDEYKEFLLSNGIKFDEKYILS